MSALRATLVALATLTVIAATGDAAEATAPATGVELRRDTLPLADGGSTPRLTLVSGGLSVAVLPELGGKITSLAGADGHEHLSRSGRPYRARRADMAYGDSEYDGIDECFPTVGACTIASGPLAGLKLTDHGELWSQAWTVEHADVDGVTLMAHGRALPYRFRRTIAVRDATVTLDYALTNDGPTAIPWMYTFHPLLRGEAASGTVQPGLEWPADQPLTVSYSHRGSLGPDGVPTTWGALRRDGRPLAERQFAADSGRYYKYIATPLPAGRATVRRADGGALMLAWDTGLLPHLAVWCWEGEYAGLNHLAPEPTSAPVDTLAQALTAGSARELAPGATVTWRITLAVQPPAAR